MNSIDWTQLVLPITCLIIAGNMLYAWAFRYGARWEHVKQSRRRRAWRMRMTWKARAEKGLL